MAALLKTFTVATRFKDLGQFAYRWGWLGFVAIAISLAALPLFRDGLTHGFDVHYHMNRLYQYQEQFFAGQLYPRWLEGSHAGYGSPTFIFYPPMFVWAALPFAAFGYSLSQQLIGSCVLAWGVAAVGTYGYMRLWLPHSRIAWLSAVLFVCTSPYFLFNIYFRGAYAEVWAMAWLVWVLWGMLIIVKTERLIYCLPLAAATAMVALSHIPTLLLLGIFGAIAPWIVADKQVLTISKMYAALAIGIVLSAFFLLPAVSFQDNVNIDVLSGFGWGVASNRLLIVDILKLSPRFNDADSFDILLFLPLMLCSATLISGSVVLIRDRTQHKLHHSINSRQALLLITGLLLSIVMMTDLALAIYRYIPTLDKIQFSWRWFALACIFTPLLWGWLMDRLNGLLYDWDVYSRTYISILLMIVLTLLSVGYNLKHDRRSPGFIADLERIYAEMSAFPYDRLQYPLTDINRFLFKDQAGNYALSDGPEYLPKWVVNLPSNGAAAWSLPEAKPLIEVLRNLALIEDVEWGYGWRRFRVKAVGEADLALRMFAWPSWQVKIDQKLVPPPLQVEAETGRLMVSVPPGEHWIEVRYVGSTAERWGWFWSGCGLAVVSGIVAWDWRQQRRLKQSEAAPAEVLD